MKLAMSAAHGGFGSERVPLGGGAAVFERLISSGVFESWDLHLLGAGPHAHEGGEYHKLTNLEKAPSALGMFEYARFCREFEEQTTQAALRLKPDVLLSHDVSEGPNMKRLTEAGIRVVTIFHVDVVDIFNRLYFKGLFSPESLTQGYRTSRSLPWPQVLKLVFEKQQQVCELGSLSIVPSSGARRLLEACYPAAAAPVTTIPWGAPSARYRESEIIDRANELRQIHQIPADHRILLTLSRLSPEKAQHRLLQAVALAESESRMPGSTTVVIAGAPAFMEGKRHAARLHKLAAKLKTRVVFPGHVGGVDKPAWYRSAELFVVNSLHESYGLTTLEAMQQGCPIVAIRSFGTQDTVSPDVGILVPPGPELVRRLWGNIEIMLNSDLEIKKKNALKRASQYNFQLAAERVRESLETLS